MEEGFSDREGNGKMKRFSVIIPADLLKRLDKAAGYWGRSKFIVDAVAAQLEKEVSTLQRHEQPGTTPDVSSKRKGATGKSYALGIHT